MKHSSQKHQDDAGQTAANVTKVEKRLGNEDIPRETENKCKTGTENDKSIDLDDVWKNVKPITHSTGIPKGRPKSGRTWKTEQTKRFSDIRKDKPLRSTWQKKMQLKSEKKNIKKYEQELKEARSKELEIRLKKKADKRNKKLENERKSEVVQVIKNTAKIKRMKKKQLRAIEKRDTTKMLKK
ncbi:LOW QUALITY PROTEIN: coiled-coil domain-containing protein 86-like [Saccoglossus kowalevskii]